MRLILKGSSSSIRHKIKKEKNFRSSLFSTPSGARLRYLQLRNRVLNIDIPPKSPFGKGGLRQGSRQWVYKQKIRWKNHRTSCCTPSGARTLDPNIKSVVLYQLS